MTKIWALTWQKLEKKKVIIRMWKGHKMYVENPRKWMKHHVLNKNGMFLLYSALHYVRKIGDSCTIRVFFLKERPCFLPFYLVNFLLSFLKIYLGSYPKIQLHVSLIICRIWLSKKQVSSHHFLILDIFTAVILSND